MTTTFDAPLELGDLSASALLDEVEVWHQQQRVSDARLVRMVTELARQHGEETVDPVQALLPGRERAVRLGGQGTPRVAEFAPALLGARLQLSPYAGRALVADVLDLEHRLPVLWRRVLGGEIRLDHARFVARRTRELTAEGAGQVDSRVAESADGRLAWSRFVDLVEASVIAADPEAAAEREERAARECFARTTHSDEHGIRGLYVRGDAATIMRIDATVAFLARALLVLGDGSTLDRRRVTAMLLMANPVQAIRVLQAFRDKVRAAEIVRSWAEADDTHDDVIDPEPFQPSGELPDVEGLDQQLLLPAVWMVVHLAQQEGTDDGAGPVARVEGVAPVTSEWVRRVLGSRCRFRITPVLDPLAQTPVDAYEVPRRHRRAVRLMSPADVFPFAANTTDDVQIDHTEAYVDPDDGGPPGQSRIGNYGPMTGFHHRIKTHGRWRVEQPFPGIYLWRDPYGALYLVDHTGTRRVGLTLAS